MKFLTHPIKLDVVTWVEYQSNALQNLQEQAKTNKDLKITQDKILDQASKMYLLPEMQKVWNSYLQKQDNIIYFRPMEVISKMTPDKIEGEFKIYYYDQLDKINLEFEPQNKIQFQPDYEEKIKTFTEEFIKNYTFRFYLDPDQPISEGNLVYVKISDLKEENSRVYSVHAENNTSKVLEHMLLHKKVGDVFETDKLGQPLKIEIQSAMYYKQQEITNENAKDILGKSFNNLDDVKKDIYKTTREQVFSDALFNYGVKIIDEVIQKSPVVELPQDLIENDLKHFNFAPTFEGNPAEYVTATIYNFFWQLVFRNKLKIDIKEEEFKNEVRFAQNLLPENQDHNLKTEAVVNAIIFKKIALHYLQKYEPQVYQENKQYTHLSN